MKKIKGVAFLLLVVTALSGCVTIGAVDPNRPLPPQPVVSAEMKAELAARPLKSIPIVIGDVTYRDISKLVDQISVVIHFLAGFSIFSGLIILASSVASTRFRRIREVVVLKTLGAKRRRIATVFSIEFTVLGLMAGAVGAVGVPGQGR